MQQCVKQGVTLRQCKDAGFTALDFKNAGHTLLQCKEVGFTPGACRNADFPKCKSCIKFDPGATPFEGCKPCGGEGVAFYYDGSRGTGKVGSGLQGWGEVTDENDRLPIFFLSLEDLTSAWHIAAQEGNLNRIRRLHDKFNVDPNTTDGHGYTALHRSAIQGHASVVGYLLENGANRSVKNHVGDTPLDRAIEHGRQAVIALLNS
jgi:hypothetical protein